jgi:hypothetical protein
VRLLGQNKSVGLYRTNSGIGKSRAATGRNVRQITRCPDETATVSAVLPSSGSTPSSLPSCSQPASPVGSQKLGRDGYSPVSLTVPVPAAGLALPGPARPSYLERPCDGDLASLRNKPVDSVLFRADTDFPF